MILLELDPLGLTGTSILRQLRANQVTRHIPVVAYCHIGEEAVEAGDRFAAVLCESLMYDDFLAALAQAGVTAPAS